MQTSIVQVELSLQVTGNPSRQPVMGSHSSKPLQYTSSAQRACTGVKRQRPSIGSQSSSVQSSASSHCSASRHGPPCCGLVGTVAEPVGVGAAPASPPAPAASLTSNGLGAAPLPPQAASNTARPDEAPNQSSARRNARLLLHCHPRRSSARGVGQSRTSTPQPRPRARRPIRMRVYHGRGAWPSSSRTEQAPVAVRPP